MSASSPLNSQEITDHINQIKLEKDPISKARLINFLNKEKDLRIIEIAKLLDHTPSYVCNILRLLRLPDIVLDSYYSKNLSLTHLMIISRLKSQEAIIAAFEKILAGSLTAAATTDLITEILTGVEAGGSKIENELVKKIKNKFKEVDFEAKIEVIQTRVQAKINISLKGNREKTSQFLKKIID